MGTFYSQNGMMKIIINFYLQQVYHTNHSEVYAVEKLYADWEELANTLNGFPDPRLPLIFQPVSKVGRF